VLYKNVNPSSSSIICECGADLPGVKCCTNSYLRLSRQLRGGRMANHNNGFFKREKNTNCVEKDTTKAIKRFQPMMASDERLCFEVQKKQL